MNYEWHQWAEAPHHAVEIGTHTEVALLASEAIRRARALISGTSTIPGHRPSLNPPSPELIDAVFANEDLFDAISGMLGAWAYLDLGCVCKSFAHDAWAHILRLLQRVLPVSHVTEGITHKLQLKHASMPAKVAHLRAVAYSLGLNANGHGLVGTLKLLTQTWPELAGQCLPGPSLPPYFEQKTSWEKAGEPRPWQQQRLSNLSYLQAQTDVLLTDMNELTEAVEEAGQVEEAALAVAWPSHNATMMSWLLQREP